MGLFLPAYFQAIQRWLAQVVPGGDSMNAFLGANRVMLINDRPDRTLADVFYGSFLPQINISYENLIPAIEQFYREVYPQLRSLTAPAPGAKETVQSLHEAGHLLVVATNPRFPASAIHQRVDWANLPLKSSDFELVTAFERFHFAKPNPAYYAEIMAFLGWPEGPAVMVGHEAANDIRAAAELGLATYHVIDAGRAAGPPTARHGSGSLADFPNWLTAQSEEDLEPDYRSAAGVTAVLKSTASALHSLVREAEPQAWLGRRDGQWSPLETLAHLRDVEAEVNLKRAENFLETESPFITGVDTDRWYADGFGDLPPAAEILDEFLRSRLKTLDILAGVPIDAWDMPARHSIFGPTDLMEIVSIMAGHDRTHMRHIQTGLESGTSGG